MIRRAFLIAALLPATLGLAWACGFSVNLREYLSASFWMPFSKSFGPLGHPAPPTLSANFAGMETAPANASLRQLRNAYQQMPHRSDWDDKELADQIAIFAPLVAQARAATLTPREREEVDLIEAKVALRDGCKKHPEPLRIAQQKLTQFLTRAKDPALRSEARGWLARTYYLLDDQTRAGKIYLDELARPDSNLSRDVVLNSIRMTYGYDGGAQLADHLYEYFDTPEHAAFAIHLVTNTSDNEYRDIHNRWGGDQHAPLSQRWSPPYSRIAALLQAHAALFRKPGGSALLATLGMRSALAAGDPAAALQIASQVPPADPVRRDPDFQWMLASSQFLSRKYAAAEPPLLQLFDNHRSSIDQRCAAAYGLCGVYRKLGRPMEQLRYALWLRAHGDSYSIYQGEAPVYWAPSGWDLNLLLEAEVSVDTLRAFINQNSQAAQIRLVKYALAVRLARENQYQESAAIFAEIKALRRAPRMRKTALLSQAAQQEGASPQELAAARYAFAEFLSQNENGIYFNDSLWFGLQRYALTATEDTRFTKTEREQQITLERKLKDDQEEYWRAYLILREIMKEEGHSDLGRKSAKLALLCLRSISVERFGRRQEIAAADVELSNWLLKRGPSAATAR